MANYPVVQQPENYSRMLFDHQKTSIHEMEKLEKKQELHLHSITL